MSSNAKILSYPPSFRRTHLPDPLNHRSRQSIDHPDPIPIIDMAHLDKSKLHVACSDWGVFRVVNHDIPEELITRLQESAKRLFDLPFESKREIFSKPNPVYIWGNKALTPAGVETPANSPELGVEIFSCTASTGRFKRDAGGGDTDITTFRHALEEYGESMAKLARELFKEISSNLKLDQSSEKKDNLNKYLDVSSGLLRVNRYLPYSASDIDTKIIGLNPHTDSSVLTILLQDDVHGLEVRKDDGPWVPIKPIPHTLLVNLGDMLQAMSNNEYRSIEHQVKLNEHERISVGYFVFPEENTMLTGSKSKYKPFTCKEFLAQVQEDVVNIGWKVGLSRFLA